MLSIIIQTIVVVVSLAASLLGAYLIYLNAHQGDIEREILDCGRHIANDINSFEEHLNRWSEPYNELYHNYKEDYPELDKLGVLNKICIGFRHMNMSSASVDKQVFMGRLKSFANDSMPVEGRLQLWLINQYLSLLNPAFEPIKITAICSDKSFSNKHKANRMNIFPHGHIGFSRWLEYYFPIHNTVKNLASFNYKEGYEVYASKMNSRTQSSDVPEYSECINRANELLENIREKSEKARQYMFYWETFQPKNNIRNLNWIIFSGGLLVLLGVIVPLILEALGGKFSAPPPIIAIPYVLIIFAALAMFVIAIIHGTIPTGKRLAANNVYRYILISELKKNKHEYVVQHDLQTINQLIIDRKDHDIDDNLLLSYRDAAAKSNKCMGELFLPLMREITNDPLFKKHRTSGGGYSGQVDAYIDMYSLFDDEKYVDFKQRLLAGKANKIIVTAHFENITRESQYNVPTDDEDRIKMSQQFDRLREKITNDEEVNNCLKKHKNTYGQCQRLLKKLESDL